MNVPLFTWSSIVVLIVLMLIVKAVRLIKCDYLSQGNRKFCELGREWEEFYVPGDRIDKYNDEYDEFDDL